MNQYDFKNIGEEIKDAVQKAIDSEDFSKLNQSIQDGVEKASHMVGEGLKTAGKTAEQKVYETMKQRANARENSAKKEVVVYKKTSGMRAGAMTSMLLGYFLGGSFGIAEIILFLTAIAMGEFLLGLRLPIIILFPFFLCSIAAGIWGQTRLRMLSRFEKYQERLQKKTYVNFKELSTAVGKSVKYIQKDLEKMITMRWFLEGHMDDEKTCLITTDETYQDYLELKEKMKKKVEEKKAISPEAEGVMEEGRAFMEAIHKSNEAIKGREISDKIASMEEIVRKIFERVDQYPQMVGDIRKLMEYYLPTTVKLLKAYEELEKQPIQGENIITSKREIEESLDTLNTAFEKLLDKLFEEQAWDVSSDISVLKTMIAQDGLAEEDF